LRTTYKDMFMNARSLVHVSGFGSGVASNGHECSI
jgi:hypothetical protein